MTYIRSTLLVTIFSFMLNSVFGESQSNLELSLDKSVKEHINITPFLLPNNHPIKSQLDVIFSDCRVLLNMKTLRAAGFVTSGPRKFTKIVIATHPYFPDYIFKFFLDAQRYENDVPLYDLLAKRVIGARLIQHEIHQNGWQDTFKVPQKWIYKLPAQPCCPKEFVCKNYILIAENMHILSDKENVAKWKSDQICYETLRRFFLLIKKLGLSDSKPLNNPFAIDGRIAFVDTQLYYNKVPLKKYLEYLSKDNKEIWKLFIEEFD